MRSFLLLFLLGTKVMCHEGGCGCCVVALERTDSVTGKNVTLSVNSVSCAFGSTRESTEKKRLRESDLVSSQAKS